MRKCPARLRLRDDNGVTTWAKCQLASHPNWLGTEERLHSDSTLRVEWTNATPGAVNEPSLRSEMKEQLQDAFDKGFDQYVVLVDPSAWQRFWQDYHQESRYAFVFHHADSSGRWAKIHTDYGEAVVLEQPVREGTELVQVRAWRTR